MGKTRTRGEVHSGTVPISPGPQVRGALGSKVRLSDHILAAREQGQRDCRHP